MRLLWIMQLWNRNLCLSAHDERVGDFSVSAVVSAHVYGTFRTDFTESWFILLHILHECAEEILGILGSHDDAWLHLGLRHVGSHGDEVDEKFVGTVWNHSEIWVDSTGNVGWKFNLYFVGIIVVVWHKTFEFIRVCNWMDCCHFVEAV